MLVAALVVTTSHAQEIPDRKAPRHEMKRKHHRGDEFKNLDLTADQQTKFKALNEENRKKMAELKKNDNITVKEWRSKMEAQQKDHRTKVQSLLTTEQKAQLEKARTERKNRLDERSKARVGGDRMDKMKTDLGLSEEQVSKAEKQS